MPNNLADISIQFALVFAGFFLFLFVGKFLLKLVGSNNFEGKYEAVFYPFVTGLLLVISLYAIVMSKGITVQFFIPPLLFLAWWRKPQNGNLLASKMPLPFLEIGFIALLSVIILHLFPESEYKQADSFFYLKIAESLNATGQENISHYYNSLSNIYHGVEPYHYFEIWVTSFFIKFTHSISSNIAIERFVSHGILLSGIVIGLFSILEILVKEKLKWYHKFFCLGLIFFLPNILNYYPSLYNVFVSDFEGNLLERPNFRIIYLLLIPVVGDCLRHKKLMAASFYFLLILSVSTFAVAVVIIPALIAFGLANILWTKQKMFRGYWAALLIFSIAFALFYFLFGVKDLPGLFHFDSKAFIIDTIIGWKFILFSIAMSALYILLIAAFYLLPIFKSLKRKSPGPDKEGLLLLFITVAISIIMARVFFLKDNAYQFLFFAHLLTSFFIWVLFVFVLAKETSIFKWVGATVFLSVFFFLRILVYPETEVNIFKQNENFVYDGKKYAVGYISQVQSYFKENPNVQGAYMADEKFYAETYYSRRNPNVYYLPISYIIAAKANNNIEYCLSDSVDIMTGVSNPVSINYLQNAIDRSVYIQFQLQQGATSDDFKRVSFILRHKLKYLIVTKDVVLEPKILEIVKNEFVDETTGERFYVFKD